MSNPIRIDGFWKLLLAFLLAALAWMMAAGSLSAQDFRDPTPPKDFPPAPSYTFGTTKVMT